MRISLDTSIIVEVERKKEKTIEIIKKQKEEEKNCPPNKHSSLF